jgi:YggT family protein
MPVGHAFFSSVLEVVYSILNFYIWVLIASAMLSWLVAFGVVNQNNRFVHMFSEFSYRITEPALRPLRRFVPIMGGLDLAPLALIFIIYFIQSFIRHLVFG